MNICTELSHNEIRASGCSGGIPDLMKFPGIGASGTVNLSKAIPLVSVQTKTGAILSTELKTTANSVLLRPSSLSKDSRVPGMTPRTELNRGKTSLPMTAATSSCVNFFALARLPSECGTANLISIKESFGNRSVVETLILNLFMSWSNSSSESFRRTA
jgi:hypothetical protein